MRGRRKNDELEGTDVFVKNSTTIILKIGPHQWSNCGGTAFPFRFWRGNAVPLGYTTAVGGVDA